METSVVPSVDVQCRDLNNVATCFSGTWGEYVGVTWDGFLVVPANGTYELFLNSDDGSVLFLDGELVLDNDGGPHVERELSAVVWMAAGYHAIHIEWFNQRRHAVCQLKWASTERGMAKQVVTGDALQTTNPNAGSTPAIFFDGLNLFVYQNGQSVYNFIDYSTLAPSALKLQKIQRHLDCYPMSRCYGSSSTPLLTNSWAKVCVTQCSAECAFVQPMQPMHGVHFDPSSSNTLARSLSHACAVCRLHPDPHSRQLHLLAGL